MDMKKELNVREFADKVCKVRDRVIEIQETITSMASAMKIECKIGNSVYLDGGKLNHVIISVECDVEDFLLFIENSLNSLLAEFDQKGKGRSTVEMLEGNLFLTIKIL
jgi:hypothetical protein